MAKRESNRLSATTVEKFKRPNARLHDGGGLYLETGPTVSKHWVLRFTHERRQYMGLGSYPAVSLRDARDLASNARKLLAAGVNPKEKRAKERTERAAQAARSLTFEAAAGMYIAAQKDGWKNAKHASQWPNTLSAYAYPKMGAVAVADVDTDRVMSVLEPIWRAKPETAFRLRGRIEKVLDWCATNNYRSGVNPARWRGHLENLLPRTSSIRKVRHHPSLDYRLLPDFVVDLSHQAGDAAEALRLLILTATRTADVIEAGVSEIDFSNRVWTISGERMKAGREHQIPLVKEALAILSPRCSGKPGTGPIFPGYRQKFLSTGAMDRLLERMGRKDITVHGFRSTFRDWAGDSGHSRELAEVSLAHKFGDETERAYRRSTSVELRRKLLTDWAKFALSKSRNGAG